MELPIEGPQVRKVLGKDVDLSRYNTEETKPPEILTGNFSHIGWFDLEEVDPNDEMWYQGGIREAETDNFTQLRFDSFDNSYDTQGWLTKYIPPMFTLEGKPIDGRGRIRVLYEKYKKQETERYVPTYYYVEDNDSVLAEITDGLSNNLRHNPAFKTTIESVITGTCVIIGNGELQLSETPIRDYLHKTLKINKHFNAANITKIVTGVLKRGEGGGDPLVKVLIRKKWESYCERAGFKLDKKTLLLCCDSDTYAYRAWCQHILPAITNNYDPTKIILFTNCHVPAEARKKVKKFQINLEYFVEASFLMVAKDLGLPQIPIKNQPYELLGCVPQIIGKHDGYEKSYRLVPIKDY